MDQPEVKRKRRTPLSCISCRNRKVKCDRHKPRCSRCEKANIACEYDSPILFSEITTSSVAGEKDNYNMFFVSSLEKTNKKNDPVIDEPYVSANGDTAQEKLKRINELKKELHDLEQSFNEETECFSLILDYDNNPSVHFVSKYNARLMAFGSFMMSSIWKRDPLMKKFIKTFVILRSKAIKVVPSNDPAHIVERYLPQAKEEGEPKYLKHMKIFEFLNSQLKSKKSTKIMLDKEGIVKKIEEVIPPLEVINFHLEYFMRYIHPFIPILDEHIFRSNIASIIISDNDRSKPKISLTSKLDYTRISLLLVIMRLSYLSLHLKISMTEETLSPIIDYVLSFPLNPDIFNIVQASLDKLQYLRKTSTETFQLLLLIRFYQCRACEDGDGFVGTDGKVFVGLITSTAKVLGLDTKFNDPRPIHEHEENIDMNSFPLHLRMNLLTRGPGPFINLWKKLGILTLEADLGHSMVSGACPLIDHDPEMSRNHGLMFDKVNSNVIDLKLEETIVKRLQLYEEIDYPVAQLFAKLHSYKSKAKVVEVEESLRNIYQIIEEKYQLVDVVDEYSRLSNVMTLKSIIEVFNSMLMIQYSLVLHQEHNALKYPAIEEDCKKKILTNIPTILTQSIVLADSMLLAWTKISSFTFNQLQNTETEYKDFILILAPAIQNALPKLMMILFFISIRILTFSHAIKANGRSNEFANKIVQFEKMNKHVLILMKTMIIVGERLSINWYAALRSYLYFKKLVEWFESGGKFALDFQIEYSRTVELKDISEDIRNLKQVEMVNSILTSFDDIIIENLNLKFEVMEKNYGLDNIHGIYKSVFVKYESADMSTIPDDMSFMQSGTTPDDHNYYTNAGIFEPSEFIDWDDVTNWFNQGNVFGDIGDSLEREINSFI